MLYRPYISEDFEALYALEELCFSPPIRFDRQTMRVFLRHSHAATWIAEEDGHMVGFAIVEWTKRKNGAHRGVTAYIQTIEVAPRLRGRGVGDELLDRIERSANAGLIWLHVESENLPAIRLYEAKGYLCQGRQEDYYPEGRAALIYLKQLDSGTERKSSM